MGAALGTRVVHLMVDDDHAVVRWHNGAARVSEALPPDTIATVTLRTQRSVVMALADGDDTLLDAVRAGRIVLRGAVRDLAAFHDALMAFLQGAVRAPSFVPTLEAFRDWQRRMDAPSPSQESPSHV